MRLPCWLRRSRICLQCRRPGFDPWVGKIPGRRKWLPTSVFLPGEFHGQRTLAGYSPQGCKKSDMAEQMSLSSVQFNHSVMSDSLRPHESQHARPPCPSPTPGVHSESEFTQSHVHRVSDAIQPSQPRLSPSSPAPNPSQHQSLLQ